MYAVFGNAPGLLGTCRDVTEEVELAAARHAAERLQAGEREALEMLANGASLRDVLTTIVLLIEELSPHTIASVLLLDSQGEHLKHGAAPNLPAEYNRAIDTIDVLARIEALERKR